MRMMSLVLALLSIFSTLARAETTFSPAGYEDIYIANQEKAYLLNGAVLHFFDDNQGRFRISVLYYDNSPNAKSMMTIFDAKGNEVYRVRSWDLNGLESGRLYGLEEQLKKVNVDSSCRLKVTLNESSRPWAYQKVCGGRKTEDYNPEGRSSDSDEFPSYINETPK